jgi:hypothetical protein
MTCRVAYRSNVPEGLELKGMESTHVVRERPRKHIAYICNSYIYKMNVFQLFNSQPSLDTSTSTSESTRPADKDPTSKGCTTGPQL